MPQFNVSDFDASSPFPVTAPHSNPNLTTTSIIVNCALEKYNILFPQNIQSAPYTLHIGKHCIISRKDQGLREENCSINHSTKKKSPYTGRELFYKPFYQEKFTFLVEENCSINYYIKKR